MRTPMCTQIHTKIYIEHLNQQQYTWGKDMYENAHIQTGAADFSRGQELEPYISRTFWRLNVLNYIKQDKSDQSVSCNSSCLETSYLWSSNKTVAVVSSAVNCYVGQAAIVIINIASVKCEQWHKSSANNKEYLSETWHIFVFIWFAINELISKSF